MRNYKRKTTRGMFEHSKMLEACQSVANKGLGLRKTAAAFGIPRQTLQRYVKKFKEGSGEPSYRVSQQVFDDQQESALVDCIKTMANEPIYYIMTPVSIRTFAYEYALKLQVDFPPSWAVNKMAGKDWFSSFHQRHPTIPLKMARSRSSEPRYTVAEEMVDDESLNEEPFNNETANEDNETVNDSDETHTNHDEAVAKEIVKKEV